MKRSTMFTLASLFAIGVGIGAQQTGFKRTVIQQENLSVPGREAVTAAIFWLKVRAGWREPVGVREYPMGKKEARELAAKTAGVGTEWEELLH